MNTETITSQQVEDFLANDQMSEVIELIKDIANGSYSADALKENIVIFCKTYSAVKYISQEQNNDEWFQTVYKYTDQILATCQ